MNDLAKKKRFLVFYHRVDIGGLGCKIIMAKSKGQAKRIFIQMDIPNNGIDTIVEA